MKKILILGVGNAQVDFIKYCKSVGFQVHACAYKNEGRGIKFVDFFSVINITDYEAIEKYIIKNKIDLVYSVGSDLAMPSVAIVSEKLSINHFISSQTALTCNNKILLREKLDNIKDGKYSIGYSYINNVSDVDDWNLFPAIIKPVDSQGQRGISLVNNHSEIEKALIIAADNSSTKTAIIEEYVDGYEISINSYIVNSKPLFLFITKRNSFVDYPGGIIKSHLYPASNITDKQQLRNLVDDICTNFEIKNGPVYFQIKINSKNIAKLIEVTPRFDGCHLWKFIKMLGGPDLFDITLKHLSGESLERFAENEFVFNNVNYAELSFFTQPPHTKMLQDKFIVSDKMKYFEWYYDDNEIVKPINNYQEKVGYQIIIDK
jgi:biotin carboxylase